MKRLTPVLALCAAVAGSTSASQVLHLELGDPARKGREIPVVLDAVTDAATGNVLTPADLSPRLGDTRILFVGESHTDLDFHRVQLRTLEELHRAGRELMIGLEMYPYTLQDHLDAWVAGESTEDEFLEQSAWYESWGYHWNYYRDIFLFARRKGVPLIALNTPREVVRAVREKGFEELSEEEARHIPTRVDVDSEEHRRLFRAFFDEDDSFHATMTEEQWDGMFNAQCTWDATMGHNAVTALRERGGEDAMLVVLVGSGHVVYDLGIPRQVALWFDGRTTSLIPIPVRDEEGEAVETVRASYADFVWGVPPEGDPFYPALGISTREIEDGERRSVIHVAEASPAEKAGVELGDVLLSMDGVELRSREDLNRQMATKSWGDGAALTVRRGGETVELTVLFRRESTAECP